MSIRVLIVDDEEPARHRLLDLLEFEQDVEVVGESPDGPSAIEDIQRKHPDLLYLDVQMPEMDGFEMLRHIAEAEMPAIVFVTAFNEYALRAFEAKALDYLLKPYSQERFRESLRRARQTLRNAEAFREFNTRLNQVLDRDIEPTIAVRDRDRIRLIRGRDIDWMKADRNYVEVHAQGSEHLVRGPLRVLQARLPTRSFLRIHNSYLVNVSSILELQPWFHGEFRLVLKDGTILKSSRTHSDALRKRFDL